MMRTDRIFTQPFGKIERNAFGEPARIHKHQRGPMLLHQRSDAVVDLVPKFVAGDRAKFLSGNFNGQIESALVANVDDYGIWSPIAGEKMRNRLNRLLRCGKANANWRLRVDY